LAAQQAHDKSIYYIRKSVVYFSKHYRLKVCVARKQKINKKQNP